MRLVTVIALISVLIFSLVGAAVYQLFLKPEPTAAVEQTWLEQKLEAIALPAAETPPESEASAPVGNTRPVLAFSTVAGGFIGYGVRAGPVGIAAGALIGYLAGTGAFTLFATEPSQKPEQSWWQRMISTP